MSFFLHLEFYEFFKMQIQSCRCHYNQDVSITLSSSFMSLFSQSFPCLSPWKLLIFSVPMDCFLSVLLHHFLKLRFYLHSKFTYLSVQFDEFWFSFQSLWTVRETLRQPQAILTLKKNYSRWRLSLQTKGSFCRLDT